MRVIFLAVLAWSAGASAAGRTVVLASGDCRDFDVLDLTQSLSTELSRRLGSDALDPNLALEKLRPTPTSTLEAVRHALDAAQTQFYDGKHEKALDGARGVEKELEKLTPSLETWKLQAQALVLEGLVLRALNDKAGSDEAWHKVLAREKDYQLDHDLYTPATLKQFEQMRRDAAKTARAELSVRSTPAGAEVLLDGRPMGKTPWHAALMAGTYRVSLASGEQRSFVHEVQLNRAVDLQVDLGFEAAVQPRRPLCIASEKKAGLDPAVRLAALAGAEQAVVVRNESPPGEEGFLAVTVVEVKQGATVRVGGMKVPQAHTPQGVTSLADFLLTGHSAPPVVPLDARPTVAAAPAPGAPVAEAEPLVPPPPPAVEATASAHGSFGRVASYGLMGVGAAAVVGGLVVFATGGGDRDALGKLIDANGNLPPQGSAGYQSALSLLSKTDANQNLTLGLCIGGGVAAAAGAVLFFLLPTDAPVHAQLLVGRDGAWAGLGGSF